MSTTKRPASGSVSPVSESKKHHRDEAATLSDVSMMTDEEHLHTVDNAGLYDNHINDAAANGEDMDVDSEGEENPDILYVVLLTIFESDGEEDIREELDDGIFEIYFRKPTFWDSDDFITMRWMRVGDENSNEYTPASSISPPSTSPPPDPSTILTKKQLRLINEQTCVSPSSSEPEASTASSISPPPSATPPPVAELAYLRFGYYGDATYGNCEALLTCELIRPSGDPSNFELRRYSRDFEEISFGEIDVYFDCSWRKEEAIVDDNNNKFLIGIIVYDDRPYNAVTLYGKQVTANSYPTKLSAGEKERIVGPFRKRMANDREEEDGSDLDGVDGVTEASS